MAVLSQQLTRDIAQAFHMGLRQDKVSAAEAKALAVFLFGLAHLSEGQAQGATAAAAETPTAGSDQALQSDASTPQSGALAAQADSIPGLPTDEAMLAQLRAFLQRTNEERGYAVKSKLLTPEASQPSNPT